MKNKIFTINPGSTSTKIAFFEGDKEIFSEVLRHPVEELDKFENTGSQYEYRKDAILRFLDSKNIDIKDIDAISARGGLINPLESGTYEINLKMVEDLSENVVHPANLAGIIAYDLGNEYNLKSFIVDPPVVDELHDIAKITGIDGIYRESKFHALNQKSIAKKISKQLEKKYDESNFIVAHIGGGISVGAHRNGRVVEVNDALDGDGPMSPNRAGALPASSVVELCFSGEYTKDEIKKLVQSKGGLLSLLGTSDTIEIEKLIEQGDMKAQRAYEAMSYQVSKAIGSCAVALSGKIDAIILTGGIAYSQMFTRMIKDRVEFLGKVVVCPGEDEMLALAEGALRVLNCEEKAKSYKV